MAGAKAEEVDAAEADAVEGADKTMAKADDGDAEVAAGSVVVRAATSNP